jgi:hypothetical protein
MSGEGEVWLTADDARKLVQKKGLPQPGAGKALLEFARDGDVRTRARRLISNPGKSNEYSKDGQELGRDVWREFLRTARHNSDWPLGVFEYEDRSVGMGVRPSPLRRLVGVEFSEADLRTLLGISITPDRRVSDHSATKGRPRAGGWDDWIAALAILVFEGGVSGSMTETALHDAVADRLAQEGKDELSRSTVQSAVKAVLKAFREQE